MRNAEAVMSRMPRSPASDEPRLHRAAARPLRGRLERLACRVLAGLERHARRQIELALGERVAEFHRAIRMNRAVEPRVGED